MGETYNQTLLARALGLDRSTLSIYLQQPGAPKPVAKKGRSLIYDFAAVQTFINSNAKSEKTSAQTDESLLDLKRRRLKGQCEREEIAKEREKIALDAAKGKYLLADKVYAEDEQMAQAEKSVMVRKLAVEYPPRLVGKTQPEIADTLMEAVLEICKVMRDPETWKSTPND